MSVGRWVTVEKLSELTGLTREAIWAYCKKGKLRLGFHYVKKGRRLHINLDRYYQWVEGIEA